jgi:hypothetical protein
MTTTPVVNSVDPASGSTSGGTHVTVSGSGLTGATQVRFGPTPSTSFTVNSDSQISALVPPGSGTVQVTVSTAGGTSTQFVTYTYVTVPAPVVNSLNPTSGPTAGGTTVVLTGSNLSGASQVRFGTTAAVSFTVVSATKINAVAPVGSGTVQVTVITPGGVSNGVPYAYTPVPVVVTSVAPSQGPTSGGNTVTLTGSGFTGATAVRFNTTQATSFTVVSDNQISAVAPPTPAGPASITVTTPGGTSAAGPYYLYVSVPGLTSLAPAQGPTAGGNAVTLTGSNLTLAQTVAFDATPAVFTVFSDTKITAIAPPGAASSAPVTVTTPGGTSTGLAYTRIPPPQI